jgi:hypothetical protein
MSQPESILDELRSARVAASPELRARVRELAASPPPPPRRERPRRRISIALVPACLALAGAGALVAGLATSGRQGQSSGASAAGSAAAREAAPSPRLSLQDQAVPQPKAAGSGGSLPAAPGRAQLYEAEVTLRVKDLSGATKSALRLTRSFGGYVRSVDYGSGSARGSASLVLRIPVGSVQEAIVRFSALGEILDQHVSIRDVQPQLDRRFRQLQALRDSIAKLQVQLASLALSAAERKALENHLVAARRRLVVLQREQSELRRRTSYATVSLDLRTADASAAPAHRPGRIGRALDRSGSILLEEAKAAVYVLVVGAPLGLLAALGLAASRLRRRRTEARLLSTSCSAGSSRRSRRRTSA